MLSGCRLCAFYKDLHYGLDKYAPISLGLGPNPCSGPYCSSYRAFHDQNNQGSGGGGLGYLISINTPRLQSSSFLWSIFRIL